MTRNRQTRISRSSGSCSSMQMLTSSSNSCFFLGALLLIFLYSLLSANTRPAGFGSFQSPPPLKRRAWNLRRNTEEKSEDKEEETWRRLAVVPRAIVGEERKKWGWRRRAWWQRAARGISRSCGQTRESMKGEGRRQRKRDINLGIKIVVPFKILDGMEREWQFQNKQKLIISNFDYKLEKSIILFEK